MAEDIKLHTARLIIHTPWVEDAQDVFTLMKGYMAEVVESMKRYLFMECESDTLIISICF